MNLAKFARILRTQIRKKLCARKKTKERRNNNDYNNEEK